MNHAHHLEGPALSRATARLDLQRATPLGLDGRHLRTEAPRNFQHAPAEYAVDADQRAIAGLQ